MRWEFPDWTIQYKALDLREQRLADEGAVRRGTDAPTIFLISSLDIERKRVIPESVDGNFTPIHNSMTLTKRDLVIRISTETDIPQQQVLEVVQRTLDYISESVAKGDNVELRNFGVFEVKRRKARKARNPRTGESVSVNAKRVPYFKPGKEMRERLNLQDAPADL